MHKGFVHRPRRAQPATALAEIGQCCIQRTQRIAEVDLYQHQLRQTGPQAPPRCADAALQQVAAANRHCVEQYSAAIGLTLTKAIPVIIDLQARAMRRDNGEHPIIGVSAARRADDQRVGTKRARTEGFAAVQPESSSLAAQLQPGVPAVGGITPEPVRGHALAQPAGLLRRVAKQLDGCQLQVVKGKQMGQRAVDRREVTAGAIDIWPGHSRPAMLAGNAQVEQPAATNQCLLILGTAAALIALNRRRGQLRRQTQQRITPGAWLQRHQPRVDHPGNGFTRHNLLQDR